jgi:hypothetical protein
LLFIANATNYSSPQENAKTLHNPGNPEPTLKRQIKKKKKVLSGTHELMRVKIENLIS